MKKINAMPYVAESALRAYLGPMLAQDAKVDLKPVVKGITAKGWAKAKAGVHDRLVAATAGKLAEDADIGDLPDLLNSLSDIAGEVVATIETGSGADPVPGAGVDPVSDDDGDMVTRLKSVLGAKGMSDMDIDAVVAALKPEVAPPAVDADKDEPAVKEDDKKAAPFGVTKAAMDAAIADASTKAAKQAETAVIERLNAARAAEADCRPWVGELAAQDTALATYQMALDSMGVDAAGITDVKALQLVLHAQQKPGERKPAPRAAMDSAAAKSFAERFPNNNRLVR